MTEFLESATSRTPESAVLSPTFFSTTTLAQDSAVLPHTRRFPFFSGSLSRRSTAGVVAGASAKRTGPSPSRARAIPPTSGGRCFDCGVLRSAPPKRIRHRAGEIPKGSEVMLHQRIHKPAPALPEAPHPDHLLQGGEPGRFMPQGGLPTAGDVFSEAPAPNIQRASSNDAEDYDVMESAW